MIEWQWKKYDELSVNDLYEILKVRINVFSVEQNCAYQDIDDLDKVASHLIAWNVDKESEPSVHGYLRVVYPTYKYNEPSIGRVLTAMRARGTGLGKELLTKALTYIESEYPHQGVRISAQQYLEKFYSEFGFQQVSQPYQEDGIAHIEMLISN